MNVIFFRWNHLNCTIYKRYIIKSIAEALGDTPVNLITGSRQTGKSTLCRQLIQAEIFKGQSVTLDDRLVLSAAQADPLGFLLDLDKHVIIDEVQRAPELFLSIKKLVDEDRKGRRFILTGSVDVMTLPTIADSLAGRMEIHNLWPLSQCEIYGKKSNFLETVVSSEMRFENKKSDWKEIIEAIRTGGYPEVIERTAERRKVRWFESYLDLVLQKDIKELSRIEGLSEIPNILQLIAASVGSTTNFSNIARLAGIKEPTLRRYITLLEHVFLILKIPPWTPNIQGQFVKSPKVYLNDTGLLCHLRGEAVESLLASRNTAGNFLENFVVLEIIKQLSWSDTILKPFHFSIHKGAEVDLVLEDRSRHLYGIEIKSAASLNQDDFKGLKQLAQLAGKKFKKGIVLYTGEQAIGGFGENMQAVPIASLWS